MHAGNPISISPPVKWQSIRERTIRENGNWTRNWKRGRYITGKGGGQGTLESFVSYIYFSITSRRCYYRFLPRITTTDRDETRRFVEIRHFHSLVRPINFIAVCGYTTAWIVVVGGGRASERASEATERYENSSARARTPPLDE